MATGQGCLSRKFAFGRFVFIRKVGNPKRLNALRINFAIWETGYFAKQSRVDKSKPSLRADFVSREILMKAMRQTGQEIDRRLIRSYILMRQIVRDGYLTTYALLRMPLPNKMLPRRIGLGGGLRIRYL